jgi:hypothetical protein
VTEGAWPAALLLVMLSLLAVAIGVIMLLVFAQVIGWRTLAKRYPASDASGATKGQSDGVVLGAWGWNAPPLRVALDDFGVWLYPRAPFTVAFHNVRLPWEAVLAVGTRHFMLFDVVEIRYGEGPKARIGFIAGATANEVASRAAARGALPLPADEA